MEKIKLPQGEWLYDPDKPLGEPGGFGAVFEGTAEGYENLAVKKLHLSASEAEHRELDMAGELINRELSYVIPILDAGLDANSENYFIIMKRADKSLADEMEQQGALDDITAVNILLEIIEGLVEVSDIVHRDLKPANVLSHEGKWKIADFGIARFVEVSTSARTLREYLSHPYAAPEQWNLQPVSNATDIYALGCIGYELITGHQPFPGPEAQDYKIQHCTEPPAPLINHDSLFSSLLNTMLRKIPQGRPEIERIKKILNSVIEQKSAEKRREGFEQLAKYGEEDAKRVAEEEAWRIKAKAELKGRHELGKEGFTILGQVKDSLFNKIDELVPTLNEMYENSIESNNVVLEINYPFKESVFGKDTFKISNWDIVVGAAINIRQISPFYEWGSSLFFTNRGIGDRYRWWEVPYFSPQRDIKKYAPFALSNPTEIDWANSSHRRGTFQMADEPKPIDDEDIEDFIDRWCRIFAQAGKGVLRYPARLPFNS